jgi:PQQ-like domain
LGTRGTPIGFGHDLVLLGEEISVRAFPRQCRRPCEPAFTTHLLTSDPALTRGDVAYVGTDRGVAILSLGCSGACRPTAWLRFHGVADLSLDRYLANPPNRYIPVGVARGAIVVQVGWDGAAGSGVYGSRLVAFALTCRHTCVPKWRSPMGVGRLPPAFAGGLVLAPQIGRIDAFPADCASRRCAPAWTGVLYRRPDITWTKTPVVVEDLAIVSTNACVCGADGNVPRVEAFPISCGTGGTTCEPRWSTEFPGTRFISAVAVHDRLAYVVADGLAGTDGSSGFGYQIDCAGWCAPSVRLDLGRAETASAPVFTGGLAFVLTRSPNRLLSFRDPCTASCRTVATAPLRHAGYGPFVARRSILVAVGRDLIAYPLEPKVGGWHPSWTWRAPFRIEGVRDRGRLAIVWGHNWTIELNLHALG